MKNLKRLDFRGLVTIFSILLMLFPVISAAEANWYPRKVKEKIIDQANSLEVPVTLALALGKVSSGFQMYHLHDNGDIGVLRVQPEMAMDRENIKKEELWNENTGALSRLESSPTLWCSRRTS